MARILRQGILLLNKPAQKTILQHPLTYIPMTLILDSEFGKTRYCHNLVSMGKHRKGWHRRQ